jgi:hypothetical protein
MHVLMMCLCVNFLDGNLPSHRDDCMTTRRDLDVFKALLADGPVGALRRPRPVWLACLKELTTKADATRAATVYVSPAKSAEKSLYQL